MNTSPNGDATPQSVLAHNILTLAEQYGYVKPNGEINLKAIADDAGIPSSTFYIHIKRPGQFKVEHLDSIAALYERTAGDLFKAPQPKAA